MLSKELPDIQLTKDNRGIYIERAGITDFIMPISVVRKNDDTLCHTTAKVECFVDLESNIKGINMSRLPIGITMDNNVNLDLILNYAKMICENSEANRCELSYSFPFFITKEAPVSKIPGIVSYDVTLKVVYSRLDGIETINKYLCVTCIASTCCPCSKEISEYNAHNQKCYITIEIGVNDFIWIEDIIKIAEQSASCEIFSILKRPDEKFVTEAMYDSPRFVEDVVREVYTKLQDFDKNNSITSYAISAVADESIHMHKAVAKIIKNQ